MQLEIQFSLEGTTSALVISLLPVAALCALFPSRCSTAF